jgi:hypothetical protein
MDRSLSQEPIMSLLFKNFLVLKGIRKLSKYSQKPARSFYAHTEISRSHPPHYFVNTNFNIIVIKSIFFWLFQNSSQYSVSYIGTRCIVQVFLTSALVGGESSASRPGRFTPGERAPGTQWIGGWVGPRTGLDDK